MDKKYVVESPVPMFRLTLTAEAFALALQHSKPLAGRMAVRRADNRWDVMVTIEAAEFIRGRALPKENWSDTVVRIINKQKETSND